MLAQRECSSAKKKAGEFRHRDRYAQRDEGHMKIEDGMMHQTSQETSKIASKEIETRKRQRRIHPLRFERGHSLTYAWILDF